MGSVYEDHQGRMGGWVASKYRDPGPLDQKLQAGAQAPIFSKHSFVVLMLLL